MTLADRSEAEAPGQSGLARLTSGKVIPAPWFCEIFLEDSYKQSLVIAKLTKVEERQKSELAVLWLDSTGGRQITDPSVLVRDFCSRCASRGRPWVYEAAHLSLRPQHLGSVLKAEQIC